MIYLQPVCVWSVAPAVFNIVPPLLVVARSLAHLHLSIAVLLRDLAGSRRLPVSLRHLHTYLYIYSHVSTCHIKYITDNSAYTP